MTLPDPQTCRALARAVTEAGNGRDGVGHGPTELEATIAAILAAPLKESPDAPLR